MFPAFPAPVPVVLMKPPLIACPVLSTLTLPPLAPPLPLALTLPKFTPVMPLIFTAPALFPAPAPFVEMLLSPTVPPLAAIVTAPPLPIPEDVSNGWEKVKFPVAV